MKLDTIKRYLIFGAVSLAVVILLAFLVKKAFFDTGITTKSVVKINSVKEIGELEVLSASVNLGITEVFDNDKAAFHFRKEGTAIYSVNLEKLDDPSIDSEKKRLFVSIPMDAISVSLYVDESSTELAAEYQERGWTGNLETGFKKHITMTTESYEKSLQELQNSDGLMASAIKSAEDQIRMLVEGSLINSEYKVVVNVMRDSK